VKTLKPGLKLTVYSSYDEISDEESDLQDFQKPDSLTAFYLDDSLKDFTIFYDKAAFKVHSNFLSPTSLYFKRVFSGQWKESNSCTIDALPSVTANHFHYFLKYLYLKKLPPKHARAVWHLCDYFEVLPALKEDVVRILLKDLTVTNASQFVPIVNKMIGDGSGEKLI
jgi:hypothetical protein